eukprot:403348827
MQSYQRNQNKSQLQNQGRYQEGAAGQTQNLQIQTSNQKPKSAQRNLRFIKGSSSTKDQNFGLQNQDQKVSLSGVITKEMISPKNSGSLKKAGTQNFDIIEDQQQIFKFQISPRLSKIVHLNSKTNNQNKSQGGFHDNDTYLTEAFSQDIRDAINSGGTQSQHQIMNGQRNNVISQHQLQSIANSSIQSKLQSINYDESYNEFSKQQQLPQKFMKYQQFALRKSDDSLFSKNRYAKASGADLSRKLLGKSFDVSNLNAQSRNAQSFANSKGNLSTLNDYNPQSAYENNNSQSQDRSFTVPSSNTNIQIANLYFKDALKINQTTQQLYKDQKSTKFSSSVLDPPSILTQHQRQKFRNVPGTNLNKSIHEDEFRNVKLIQHSETISTDMIRRNNQSLEYNMIDRRPKKTTYHQDFISGELKPRPITLVNSSTRMLTSYKDQGINHHHFDPNFSKKVEQFPSVFRKTNGEFTAYSSAFVHHKNVMCKIFSPAQKAQVKL